MLDNQQKKIKIQNKYLIEESERKKMSLIGDLCHIIINTCGN